MAQEMNWKTVSEGSEEEENKLVFDQLNDSFIGTFLGMRRIDPRDITESSYEQARFRGEDNLLYFTNANYSLKKGLREVRQNTLCRITFVGELDTGMESPMKQFRVETAGRPSGVRSDSDNT